MYETGTGSSKHRAPFVTTSRKIIHEGSGYEVYVSPEGAIISTCDYHPGEIVLTRIDLIKLAFMSCWWFKSCLPPKKKTLLKVDENKDSKDSSAPCDDMCKEGPV